MGLRMKQVITRHYLILFVGLNNVPLETQFESFIHELEQDSLNNCINKKLDLNSIF